MSKEGRRKSFTESLGNIFNFNLLKGNETKQFVEYNFELFDMIMEMDPKTTENYKYVADNISMLNDAMTFDDTGRILNFLDFSGTIKSKINNSLGIHEKHMAKYFCEYMNTQLQDKEKKKDFFEFGLNTLKVYALSEIDENISYLKEFIKNLNDNKMLVDLDNFMNNIKGGEMDNILFYYTLPEIKKLELIRSKYEEIVNYHYNNKENFSFYTVEKENDYTFNEDKLNYYLKEYFDSYKKNLLKYSCELQKIVNKILNNSKFMFSFNKDDFFKYGCEQLEFPNTQEFDTCDIDQSGGNLILKKTKPTIFRNWEPAQSFEEFGSSSIGNGNPWISFENDIKIPFDKGHIFIEKLVSSKEDALCHIKINDAKTYDPSFILPSIVNLIELNLERGFNLVEAMYSNSLKSDYVGIGPNYNFGTNISLEEVQAIRREACKFVQSINNKQLCEPINKGKDQDCEELINSEYYENYNHILNDPDKWKEESYDHLRDPISHELLENPYIASDGHTYSRTSLLKIFTSKNKSPFTREPLIRMNGDIGIPNIIIKNMLEKFYEGKLKISHGGNKNNDHYYKYIKYKEKYMNLKKN